VKVMQRFPAPPAPYIMLTVATSLTAWTKTPLSSGSTFASAQRLVEGVIGSRRTWRQPASTAPTAAA